MSLAEIAEMPRARSASTARFKRTCPECGEAFVTSYQAQDFCCEPHKKAFNNRRMLRGAELYDLFMALRCERKLAVGLGVWRLICRLAQGYREEDEAQRAGRKSWRAPQQVIARHPYLQATVLHRNINPKKPGGLVQ